MAGLNPAWISFVQSSSARCGANGCNRIKNSRRTAAGLVSQLMASLTKTISAEMAALRSGEDTAALPSHSDIGCRLLLGKKNHATGQMMAAIHSLPRLRMHDRC